MNFRLVFLVCTAFLLAGCASGARPGAMTTGITNNIVITENSKLHKSISLIETTGGRETNPLWTSQVSSSDFEAALKQSLALNAMLADADPKFELKAELLGLDQPVIGFDFTVTARVHYVLIEKENGNVVFEQDIVSPYTADFSDSLVAVERLRLANEGAVKANIEMFIQSLQQTPALRN